MHPSKALSNNWAEGTKIKRDLCKNIVKLIISRHFFLSLNCYSFVLFITFDIKIAIPFVPIATILFTIALVLRLFHGGHNVTNPNFIRTVWLMFVANIINIIGFTFIMEAPSGAYLNNHPSSFWTFLKTHLRSNADPKGLELSQVTFYICFPILILVFIWGFMSAIGQLKKKKGE